MNHHLSNKLAHSMFQNVMFPRYDASEGQLDLVLHKNIRFCPHPKLDVLAQSLVVFDFETTGLESSYDRVIEIGAQKIVQGEIVAEFATLIEVKDEISPLVQKLTGITPQMLAGQPSITEALPLFLEFIAGSILVAHNAPFDMSFLKAEAHRQGIDLDWPAFCTLKLARELLPELESKTLDQLALHYEVSFESRHRSIGDVKVTTAILHAMLNNEGHALQEWLDFEPFRA